MESVQESQDSQLAAKRSWAHALLLPDDVRQALRMRRYLMAAGTSLLVVLLVFICAWMGQITTTAAEMSSAMIITLILVFYVLFRFGLNLRFSDPSLTTEQIGASILVIAFVLYSAPLFRGTLMILYFVTLMFGLLRLGTGRLLALSALTFVAHGLIVVHDSVASEGLEQGISERGLAQLAVLAIVLPWFSFMGGYVNKLRSRLSDTNRNLTAAVDRIEQLAIRDVLTGAFNRRHLVDTLERERARAKRVNSSLCICLFDIDHFKSVNDTYGHACGDEVLKHFAFLVGQETRANDVFGRYGGEEFMMILPDTDLAGADAVAQRALARVANAPFPGVPAARQVTATAGVAQLVAGEEANALIERADKALYAGKAGGRNRTALG